MPTPDAHFARLDEQILGIRDDVTDLVTEMNRTRGRLHDLEGIAATFVEVQKVNRRREEEQYQKLGLRMQLGMLLLTLAAVLSPIIVLWVHGK